MIFSIADFFIRRPIFASVCSIAVTLLGLACIPTLPIAQYPDIAAPQITVTSNYIGASAEVVESTVTNILERELNGLPGVKYIKSTSASDGTSNLSLTFDLGKNQDLAAVDVQNKVSTVESRLPTPVTQTGVRVGKESTGFLLAVGLYAELDEKTGKDRYDDIYLSNYADLYIADALKRIQGVGNVQIFGERKYAMRLWLDPDRLASRRLTPQDVVTALREQNLQVGAGQIGQPPVSSDQQYQYSVTAQGRLKTVEEFNDLVVRTEDNGTLIRFRDVGRAELGAENYSSVLRFTADDRVSHRGIGLGVSQQFGSNALETAAAVKREMQELAKDFPPGMRYEIAFDTTLFIEAGATEVLVSLMLAILLVVIIIFLFLQNWRSAVIVSIAIPVALIGSFVFVKLLGFSINTLTLFGLTLATGLVVDDAIVIVEDITKRVQEDNMHPVEAAIASMNSLLGAVIATSIVLITVFVPIAFFPGTTGQLYRQFALTIAFCITVSTFNAITLTPTLSAVLLRKGQAPNNWFFNAVNRVIASTSDSYARNVSGLTRRKGLVLFVFGLSLALTYWVYTIVPGGFLPDEDQGYFITIVQAPEGVSLSYTEKVLEKVEEFMKERPEVKNIFAVGGFSFSGATPNNGLIFTTLKPWAERPSASQSVQAIIGAPFPPPGQGLFPKLFSIPEAIVVPVAPPPILGIGNFGGFEFHLQNRGNLDFKVMGETLEAFLGAASQNRKLSQLRPTFNANTPQIAVEVDRVKANALQVSPEEIFNTLQVFLGSTYVNDFNLFERTYRVYVQADQQFRSNPEDINKLYVRSQRGSMIPLSNLVKVEQTIGPSIISHYNLLRSIEITGSGAPGVSSGQAIREMETIAKNVLPRGFGFQWSGLSLEEVQSGGQAILIFGLGLVFVYLTLAAQYESYVDPAIIMLTVPLAILGALFAVLVRGLVSDVYTQIGFVMLIGMASKNAILIVEFANQLRAEGVAISKAVVEACKDRLRPILMTAISTIIGAVPLFIASGAGAAARRSLGTTIIGGMGVATILSLFIVPVLYIIIKSAEARFQERRKLALATATGYGDGSYSDGGYGNGNYSNEPTHDRAHYHTENGSLGTTSSSPSSSSPAAEEVHRS